MFSTKAACGALRGLPVVECLGHITEASPEEQPWGSKGLWLLFPPDLS